MKRLILVLCLTLSIPAIASGFDADSLAQQPAPREPRAYRRTTIINPMRDLDDDDSLWGICACDLKPVVNSISDFCSALLRLIVNGENAETPIYTWPEEKSN